MVEPAPGALYDGESLAWRLNRESMVLLGGPRAAILQICDPGVAAGVAAFSTYRTDPFGRLQRTLDSMFSISFGSPQIREDTLRKLDSIHSHVSGALPDGSGYSALDTDRQLWVLATLTDTVLEVDRRFGGKLREPDRVAYYREGKRIYEAFGIPEDDIPDDLHAFRDYFAERVATLEPTQDSRDVARTLMYPRIRPIPGIAWLPFTLVTKEMMPARLLSKLGFSRANAAELATVRAAQMVIRNSVAHVGGILMTNPLASAAVGRVA